METAELTNQINALMEDFKATLYSTISGETNQNFISENLQNGTSNGDFNNNIVIFQNIHSRAAETRKDTMLVDDIRTDLKTMEQEKEYLLKKVEKAEEKLRNVPNLQKILDLATSIRLENRRRDILTLQIQEQTNVVCPLPDSFVFICWFD